MAGNGAPDSHGPRDITPPGRLDAFLLGLVRLRIAQIQGCGPCLDMRTQEARARGEHEERLYLLDTWREAACYAPAERAALAFCEAIALADATNVPTTVYRLARRHFGADQLVALTRLATEWISQSHPRRAPGVGSAALPLSV